MNGGSRKLVYLGNSEYFIMARAYGCSGSVAGKKD